MRNVLLSLLMVAASRVRESEVGSSAGPGPFPACELLAPAEVAGVVGASPRKKRRAYLGAMTN
jgi:hypothetical protein